MQAYDGAEDVVLLFGDYRQPALRHEVPLMLPDPILYLEVGGRRSLTVGALDLPRMRALGGVEVKAFEELGFDALLAAGHTRREALNEGVLRSCRELGVTAATVSPELDLQTADLLRANGISLVVDEHRFELRRRRKTEAELAGIERAQRAAVAALNAVVAALRTGGEHTSDSLRQVARVTLIEHDALPHDMTVIACGPDGADPFAEGDGPIRPHEPIVIDIFPRDLGSGCWGDLTRTVCLGEPPPELVAWHADVRAAQKLTVEAVRPGASGEELNRIACAYLEERGHATRLGLRADTVLEDGVLHYLGHGVGLELLEAPTLDEGGETLIAGDVITIEPAIYRPGFGGCRLEDLVAVTEDGCRNLTDCSYELQL